MEHTKQKFLLELENYFTNFPHYTIGEVLYSLLNNTGNKANLLELADEKIIHELEKAQFIETEN